MNKIYSLEYIKNNITKNLYTKIVSKLNEKNYKPFNEDTKDKKNEFINSIINANLLFKNDEALLSILNEYGYDNKKCIILFSNNINSSSFEYKNLITLLKEHYNTEDIESLINKMRCLILYSPRLFLSEEEKKELDQRIDLIYKHTTDNEYNIEFSYDIIFDTNNLEEHPEVIFNFISESDLGKVLNMMDILLFTKKNNLIYNLIATSKEYKKNKLDKKAYSKMLKK